MNSQNLIRDNIEIVLIQPRESLNIGSVARAMKNYGFYNLSIIDPDNYSEKKAHKTACWADDIVDSIKQYDSISAGLSNYTHVVGFSPRAGKTNAPLVSLPDWATQIKSRISGKLALVFGPEDHGLTQEQSSFCREIVCIPSAAEYTSFNLAQAVLLVLSELSRDQSFLSTGIKENRTLPTWNEFEQLERIVDNIANVTEFYREGTPKPIPLLIKNLVRRLEPDEREMSVLLAFFSRVGKTLEYLRASKS